MAATVPDTPSSVGLSLEAPGRARRWTVALRIILAIPHLITLLVIILVGLLGSVVGWVAALFIGRLPQGIGDFLGGVVRYTTRVYGYLYLLTDRYPPFSTDPRDYPVEVVLPARGDLHRAAVLFRFILAIPALIMASIVATGLQVVLIVVWLITLVAGRTPRPAFEAGAAVLRYEARVYAWFLMLTSEYPRGLLGDPPLAASPPPVTAAYTGAGPAAGAESTLPPPPAPVAPPRITALVLSKGGKRLVRLIVVLGVVLTLAQVAVGVVAGVQSTEAQRVLDREYEAVAQASTNHGFRVQTCAASGDTECVREADREFAAAVRQFEAELTTIEFPAGALPLAQRLHDHTRQLAEILEQLAMTPDSTAYESLVAAFQVAAAQVDDDYLDLRDQLRYG